MYEIIHKPYCGVTCLFKFWRKKSHAPTDSLLTTTKAIWRTLLLSSCATAIRRVPLYLPYNHIPSTWTTGLQYWNPLIHGLKLQKRRWHIMKSSTSWPPCGGIGSVSFSTTIPGRNCCITCNNLDKLWYDLPSYHKCFQWNFFANHALRYVVVYPSVLLMCAIKVGTEVDGSFSIKLWMLLLMSKYDSFAWSCEIHGFEYVWGSQSFLISHYLLARMYDALHLQAQLSLSQMTISFVGFNSFVL